MPSRHVLKVRFSEAMHACLSNLKGARGTLVSGMNKIIVQYGVGKDQNWTFM